MLEPNSLKTDLYELTMAAGYYVNKVDLRAVFELFCHKPHPNTVVVLEDAIKGINLKHADSEEAVKEMLANGAKKINLASLTHI